VLEKASPVGPFLASRLRTVLAPSIVKIVIVKICIPTPTLQTPIVRSAIAGPAIRGWPASEFVLRGRLVYHSFSWAELPLTGPASTIIVETAKKAMLSPATMPEWHNCPSTSRLPTFPESVQDSRYGVHCDPLQSQPYSMYSVLRTYSVWADETKSLDRFVVS
jgi:hypothetical protein